MSLGRTPRMNAITAIATTHVMAMITGLFHVGQIVFDLVLILLQCGIVDFDGPDFRQRFGLAVLLQEHPNYYQAESYGRVRHNPAEGAGWRQVSIAFLHEGIDDLLVAHA